MQLGLCLVMLVLRILDLLLFTDPATGFVETGWFGLRILLPAAVAVLAYLTARRAAPPWTVVPPRDQAKAKRS